MKQSLLEKFVSFIIRPTYCAQSKPSSILKTTLDIARLFAFLYLIVIVLGFITSFLINLSGYDIAQNAVVDLITNEPILISIVLGCVIAPLNEELTFRLGLRFSYKKFALSFSFILIMLLDLLRVYIFKDILPEWFLSIKNAIGLGGLSYLIFLTLFGVIIYFLAKKFIKFETAENFYKKHIGVLFYFSCICFALIHITNYLNLRELILIAPFFVLPQFIAGIFLGYIRMNYGFKWGILTHSIYNFLTLAPFVALSFGSENLKKVIVTVQQNIDTIHSLSNSDLIILFTIGIGGFLLFLVFFASDIYLFVEYFLTKRNYKSS